MQWHQLDHMQTIYTWLDALPDVQPTVSKHWRQTAGKLTCCKTRWACWLSWAILYLCWVSMLWLLMENKRQCSANRWQFSYWHCQLYAMSSRAVDLVCANPSSWWMWVGEGFFWYWLTRVVTDKGPLNSCVCYAGGHVDENKWVQCLSIAEYEKWPLCHADEPRRRRWHAVSIAAFTAAARATSEPSWWRHSTTFRRPISRQPGLSVVICSFIVLWLKVWWWCVTNTTEENLSIFFP